MSPTNLREHIQTRLKQLHETESAKEVETMLIGVAEKYLDIDSFKDVGHDAEDFKDVGRSSVGRALHTAYKLGKQAGRHEALHGKGKAEAIGEAKAGSGFKCMECGKKFATVKAAEKASINGCPKCGGTDIDLDVGDDKSPPKTEAPAP